MKKNRYIASWLARRLALTYLFLALIVSCSSTQHKTSSPSDVITGDRFTMKNKVINISDDEYFSDFSHRVNAIKQDLSQQNIRGIFVDGPQKVDGTLHTHLPILVIEHRRFSEGDQSNFTKNAVLIGTDLTRNITYANSAIELKEGFLKEEPVTLPGAPHSVPKGTYATYYVADVRSRLGLPWLAGKYAFYIGLQDKIYNTVYSEIFFNKNTPQLSTSQLPYTTRPVTPFDIFPLPEDDLLNFSRRKNSPELPTGKGVTISLGERNELKKSDDIPLFGSFKLSPKPHEVVNADDWKHAVEEISKISKTSDTESKTLRDWLVADQAQRMVFIEKIPTALVPITLIVSSSEDGFITSYSITIPTYENISDQDTVSGHFSVNFSQIPFLSKKKQTYFVTVASNEGLEKPLVVKID